MAGVWRRPTRLAALAAARASVRVQIVARHGRIPPCRLAGTDLGDWIVIRLDASIVIAHSDKEAATTFKKTFGHHPLTAWCDNTGELLAVLLRPGNAGSNTAADHLTVLKAATAARWLPGGRPGGASRDRNSLTPGDIPERNGGMPN